MKLGEALVEAGLITRQQLEAALQRQVQFGGRIGTNLVELQVLGEEELTKFLGRYFKIPAVTPEMIASIDEEVMKSLGKETIEKYRILPFRKERNRLHTAMLNPNDLGEIDELRFITGFDIVPYAIAELRLLYSLEKLFGIKRDPRYISLTDRFNPEAKREVESIDRVKAAFTDVRETEEIADILIHAAHKIASRVAVFILKGGKIVGWKGRGINVDGFAVAEQETREAGLSLLSDVLKRKAYYRGPVLNSEGNESLIKILSGTPQDALLIPVEIRGKVVAMLYIDNGNTSVLNANVGFLSKLAIMAGISFEIIILKKRIMEQ